MVKPIPQHIVKNIEINPSKNGRAKYQNLVSSDRKILANSDILVL